MTRAASRVVGVATDDRGMSRVELRGGGRLVAENAAAPDLETAEQRRTLVVPAAPGAGARPERDHGHRRRRRGGGAAGEPGGDAPAPLPRDLVFLPSVVGASVGLLGLGFAVQGYRRRRAVRRRFNPYIAGAPVMDESMFFGRQKLLTRLLNVLHHNSLMITGERRIGKTTFLYHLKKVLEADEGVGLPLLPRAHRPAGRARDRSSSPPSCRTSWRASPCPPPPARACASGPGVERYDGRDFSHDLQRVLAELKTRTRRKVKLACSSTRWTCSTGTRRA